MSIPNFILPADPKAQYLALKEEIDAALHRMLENGRYILGPETATFEKEFAAYIGAKHCIGVGSGTEALQLGLRALGIGPGDVVLTVSHTAVATVAAIELTGAKALLVDVDPKTYVLTAEILEANRAAHPNIKAVIPVHLYGWPAHIPTGIPVLEDCAQAHGASCQGKRLGSLGTLAEFSFYPTKNLGAIGDGGAVLTSDDTLAEKVRILREYGWKERYVSHVPGLNSRLDEMQAAILRVKLKYLDRENARRLEIARQYTESFATLPVTTPPAPNATVEPVYHQYVLRTQRRDELIAYLKVEQIGALIHYPVPVHLQPAYKDRVLLGKGGLPNTEKLCKEIVSLPMHPYLTDEQVERTIKAVRAFLKA